MAQRHNLAFLIVCNCFQASGDRILVHNQGMISGNRDGIRQILENRRFILNGNLAGFAVHQLTGSDDGSAKSLADGLVSQANA